VSPLSADQVEVLEGEAPRDSVAVGLPVTVLLVLMEVLAVTLEDCVGEAELLAVGVGEGVARALALPESDTEAELEGLAPAVKDAVGEALTVALPLPVVDGVPLPLPVALPVALPVGVCVALCVGVALADCDWLGEIDGDAPRESVAEGVALCEAVRESVVEGLLGGMAVGLAVAVGELVGEAVCEGDTLAEPDTLPVADGEAPTLSAADGEASVFPWVFTAITRPMIDENSVQLSADTPDDPGLDTLETLDDDERQRLSDVRGDVLLWTSGREADDALDARIARWQKRLEEARTN
jgi:hypothetical protein